MKETIADYVLGALDASQARVVEQHIERCAACRRCLEELRGHEEALVGLGTRLDAGMSARREKVLEALESVAPAWSPVVRVSAFLGGFVRMAAAAVLVLTAGIVVGRATGPRPVDIDRLRTEVEASVVAGLRQVVQDDVLTEVDRRMQAALSANDAQLERQVAEQIRGDLRAFAAQFMSDSQALMDRRFAELVELIEAARLKDRQRVAKAFEQIELNRLRDRREIGFGLRSLAVQTADAPTLVEN
jgi:hypothetical protein